MYQPCALSHPYGTQRHSRNNVLLKTSFPRYPINDVQCQLCNRICRSDFELRSHMHTRRWLYNFCLPWWWLLSFAKCRMWSMPLWCIDRSNQCTRLATIMYSLPPPAIQPSAHTIEYAHPLDDLFLWKCHFPEMDFAATFQMIAILIL